MLQCFNFPLANSERILSVPAKWHLMQFLAANDGSGHINFFGFGSQNGRAQRQSEMVGRLNQQQLGKRVLPSLSVESSDQGCFIVDQTL